MIQKIIMKQGNNVASKTNIITLNVLNKPKQVTSPRVLEQLEDDRLVNKFHDAVMTISNKVDIKGFALVAWDEKRNTLYSLGYWP
jgi:hypothetical protein